MNREYKVEIVYIERGKVTVSKYDKFLRVVYQSENNDLTVCGMSVEELLNKMKHMRDTRLPGDIRIEILEFMIDMTRRTKWEDV